MDSSFYRVPFNKTTTKSGRMKKFYKKIILKTLQNSKENSFDETSF